MTSPANASSVAPIDFSHYNPPGVYMNPQPGPQLAVNGSQPTAVGIFGLSLGYRQYVETVQIPQDTSPTVAGPSQTLANAGIDLTSVKVINPATGAVYTAGSDYTVVPMWQVPNSGVPQSAPADQMTYVIERVIDGGTISQLETVQVSYQYTDGDFTAATTFYDYDDVKTAYGDPWEVKTATVQSELTLAAQFAFLNGAYQVVCTAVMPTGPANPTTGAPTAQDSDYQAALDALRDQNVAVVVMASGTRFNLLQAVSQHVNQQSASQFERRAILGLDGSVVPVNSTTRQNYASGTDGLNNSRVMLVSPATFSYYAMEVNKQVTVGGQFMAASLAGMTVAMSGAMPLTRKRPTGWNKVPEVMVAGAKDAETQSGLCVVEQTRTNQIQVRHGVSTNFTDLITREWSITGQQDALAYRLRDYLNSANLIGQPIYPYTLANVKGSADAALQSLIRDGLLVDYMGLKVRQLVTNPDVLEVSFQWLPAFPLNYIVVSFAISLTSGAINSQGSTASATNSSSVINQVTSNTITPPATPQFNDFGGAGNTLQSN